MFPAFTFLGKTIGLYSLMACVGAVAVFLVLFLLRKKKKTNINFDNTILFALFVGAGILIGGHLLYAITNYRYFYMFGRASNAKEFFVVVKYIFGGSVFYGGLIGGTLFGYLGLRIMKLDLKQYADVMALSAPLFHAFARIGCFLGGCCYGIESKFGFVAHGNKFVPELNGVCRFPVQLLESACNFLIFGAILCLFLKKKLEGKLFFVYLMAYSVVRFCDEFLRGDEIRGFLLGLSTSQFISVIIFPLAALGLFMSIKKSKEKAKTRGCEKETAKGSGE